MQAATVPPAPVSTVPQTPAYRDRSTGLVLFGVGQIILGLLAALLVPLAALGAFFSRLAPGGRVHPTQLIVGMASYAIAAAVLIGLGIGSIRYRRWARALTLVISWYWLIVGVLITILLTAVLPLTMRAVMRMQQNTATEVPPAGVMAVIVTVIIVFAAFFLVVVPIAFVVFYGREDVAETCRHRDPVERWTDRTPLPVLGASVVFFIGAVYMLVVGVSTPLFPFFGRYLTGPAGAAAFLVLAALDLYLAFALFRLRMAGWWIAIFTLPVRVLSMALTYARADLMQAYSKMGWSDAEIDRLNANPVSRSHAILWWSLLTMIILLFYLLWLKRYFKAPAAPSQAQPLPAELG